MSLATRPRLLRQFQGGRQDKLLGWAGFDDHISSHKVTVILKQMFQPEEIRNGIVTKEELKEDVENECAKLGEVDRVVVYGENAEGVISVRFRHEEAADVCIQRMDGRFFSKRRITAHKWGRHNRATNDTTCRAVLPLDGFTKYHRAPEPDVVQDEETRLEKFARDLEQN